MKKWVESLSDIISKYITNMKMPNVYDPDGFIELRRDLRLIREELRNNIAPDNKRNRKMDSWILSRQEIELDKEKREKSEEHGSVL